MFLTINLFGQQEGNIWYFGKNIGIDFNTKKPKLLTNGAMNTFEGCSSISDANGNLLLYTDGISIWNSKHEIIKGGNDLHGNPSSTQSGIIVAKPYSKSIYYVFTVDAMEDGLEGLEYAMVDVEANNRNCAIIEKHKMLLPDATEKVTGVVHQNGQDIWILTHQWESDAFYAFLITKDGINKTPIISKTGSIHKGELDNSIGYLKASPNGDKLAIAIHDDKKFELFDFDNSTGKVSNPKTLTVNRGKPYGVEFSPKGKYLYTSTFFNGEIAQYNLRKKDLQESKVILRRGDKKNVGALQLGPNGKIYYQIYNSQYLGAIEKPNRGGEDCFLNPKAIKLGAKIARFGFPTFIQTYFTEENMDKRLIDKPVEAVVEKVEVAMEPEVDIPSKPHFSILIKTKEVLFKVANNPSSEIIGKTPLSNVNVVEYKIELRSKTNKDGLITIEGFRGKDYQFQFSKDGYFSTNLAITKNQLIEKMKVSTNSILEFEVTLDKIFKNIEINLDDVYYDYNEASVQTTSLPVLEQLANVLNQNPTISIQLSAHTDCRGTNTYNQTLSQKRAEFVVKHLISKGINAKRLTAKGFGESSPAEHCKCENCSKEQHQMNRRTTFKVL